MSYSKFLFRHFVLVLVLVSALAGPAFADTVRIGVLANNGRDICLRQWLPTADYLAGKIPDYAFEIVPLDFSEIETALAEARVEFVTANPSIHIGLEINHGVSPVATMRRPRFMSDQAVFGGVIFTRSDRTDIKTLADLRGKRFAAADETSQGGFLVAVGVLKKNGIDPYKDFSPLSFAGTHRQAVSAVLDKKADAGTARTDTLEAMAAEGLIDLKALRVFPAPEKNPGAESFPFLLSTPLYPEWPMAKARHTDDSLARRVSAALLTMSGADRAAQEADILGWTVPRSYEGVKDLLRELRMGPFRDYGQVSLAEAVRQHTDAVVLASALLAVLAGAAAMLLGLNRKLRRYRRRLENELSERERIGWALARSNAELTTANEELDQSRRRIMESLRYARTIQCAVLPDQSSLDWVFAEHLEIYQPRDIVGGDLYYLRDFPDHFLYAVLDCTGHGVPGAIMAMTVHSVLNHVTSVMCNDDPAVVLRETDKVLRQTLGLNCSSENRLDCGLEIALCCYKRASRSLVFAGAGLSLFLLRGDELREIKGDRQRLGFRESFAGREYTNHVIEDVRGTRFYAATDGFLDEGGGEKGYCFGQERFRALLLAEAGRPMAGQAEAFLKTLAAYRGERKQRDDVTLVGFTLQGG
jgi:serine phosphatase RsbU (regulator of sigma subunit)/ABC-type phosphate/phosphonate transport system substrate-binding protein